MRGDRERNRDCGADSSVSQVLQEQPRTLCQARVVRVSLMPASASIKVVAELHERLLVRVLNRPSVPIAPVDEMLCRSQISACGNGGVARFRQCKSKPVEH